MLQLIILNIAQQITRLIQITEPVAVCLQPLRRHQQDILAVQMEEIGTFPHVTFRFLGLGLTQFRCQFPVQQVLGAVNQRPAEAVNILTAQHHVEGIAFLPDFRVTEVFRIACRCL